jgi:chaperone modulatory protein CbpM
MISRQQFLVRAQVDDATLTAWIEEEWIIPRSAAAEPEFADVDVARPCP